MSHGEGEKYGPSIVAIVPRSRVSKSQKLVALLEARELLSLFE